MSNLLIKILCGGVKNQQLRFRHGLSLLSAKLKTAARCSNYIATAEE